MKGTGAARKKILITLCGGGHLWQAMRLIEGFGDAVDYAYVTNDSCTVPPQFAKGDVFVIKTISRKSAPHWWQALPNLMIATLQAYGVVREVKPDAIVCIAAPVAVPLAVSGKLFGKKVIFVESITRVTTRSLTSRILEALRLVDRMYVQWPESVGLYKKAIYKGTVL